jgi:hypothetical protein
VPFVYNPGERDPEQMGFVGVLPEEAPLPSEVVLDGGILDRRRREAVRALRELLVHRPPEIPPEEWRVVVATLASPVAHLPRVAGGPARMLGALTVAKECFPGLAPTTALRHFREVQERPAVRSFLADFRALELADIMDQRAMVREALHATIRFGADALHKIDPTASPNEWAKISACNVAACKVLTDMDRLALQPAEIEALRGPALTDEDDAGAAAALEAKLRPVLADVRARRGATVRAVG